MTKQPNKLFIWRGPDVLKRVRSGIAFAFAPNADYARMLIRLEITNELEHLFCSWDADEYRADKAEHLGFLDAEPEVFEGDNVAGFFIEGSE